jgi:putative flippase GtrA
MSKLVRRWAPKVSRALPRRAGWLELARFAIVGASGYAINLAVFSSLVEIAGSHYVLAATSAFCVAVTNNFLLNRYWTFRATHVAPALQAPRFVAVSLCALGLNLAALHLLVAFAGLHQIAAQAVAIAFATPISFVGNKLWSFSSGSARIPDAESLAEGARAGNS